MCAYSEVRIECQLTSPSPFLLPCDSFFLTQESLFQVGWLDSGLSESVLPVSPPNVGL